MDFLKDFDNMDKEKISMLFGLSTEEIEKYLNGEKPKNISEKQAQDIRENGLILSNIFNEEVLKARNKPLLYDYLCRFSRSIDKEKHSFKLKKIDKSLPQIILPLEKVDTILEWWNDTIRFEKEIPQAYSSGYIRISYELKEEHKLDRKLMRQLAEVSKVSVYEIKDSFTKFISNKVDCWVYFNFVKDNKIHFEILQNTDKGFDLIYSGAFEFGDKSGKEEIIKDTGLLIPTSVLLNNMDSRKVALEMLHKEYFYYFAAIIATVMWYITVSGNKTKYTYEHKEPKYNYSKKSHRVLENDYKYITYSIYDIGKAKTINIDKLNHKKAGWTYSHSFQVHGHYRHYKSGKVVFIKPFTKGENKKLKNKEIIISPKEI